MKLDPAEACDLLLRGVELHGKFGCYRVVGEEVQMFEAGEWVATKLERSHIILTTIAIIEEFNAPTSCARKETTP